MQLYELRQAHYDTKFSRTLSNSILTGTKEQCWQEAFKREWVPLQMDLFWWDDALNFHNGYCSIQLVTP
jgi:hypothetical protein